MNKNDDGSVLGYLILLNVILIGLIVYSLIAINFYKDVPYNAQHWFGHDLEAYRAFEKVVAGIVGGVLAIVDIIAIIVSIVHTEKHNMEEK